VKHGFIKNVYSLDEKDLTIKLKSLPPLQFKGFYNDARHKKSPILRLIWLQQSNKKEKVIVLDEIKLNENKTELRLRYYIIGDKPRMRGKWVFGQFATFVPHDDFRMLVSLAKKYKMI
jgi:hypothetical protein